MSELLNLENTFQNYLMHADTDIQSHIISTNKVPADVRLYIYGYAYKSRLYETLIASYPALETYLGKDVFETLCYEYIEKHPSEFRSLRWFGDRLSQFLSTHPIHKEQTYLTELATLEWALDLAFDAPDEPIVSIEQMSAIAPEAWAMMQFKIHPSVYRFSFTWNITLLWKNLIAKKTNIDPEKINTEVLVWREKLASQFSSLSPDEAWAIDTVMKGANFGELCEELCQRADEKDTGVRAASLLKGWISAEIISDITR